ncbi:MAG: 3D domain-containing protein [Hungatella sp.]
MKQRHRITGTLLTMLLLLYNITTVWGGSPDGRLDGIHGNAIYGWAWDSITPDTPVDVRIVVKKQATSDIVQDSTVTASQYREDLLTSSKGNGKHAFVVEIDWSKLENCAYTVEAFVGEYPLINPLQYQDGQISPVSQTGSLRSLGIFRTTAYCPCYLCSEGWGRHTSTGAMAVSQHTIAVDPRVIPYGSKVLIDGILYTAEDRGGGVKGNHIDIFFNTHGETRQHGTRNTEVFLVK